MRLRHLFIIFFIGTILSVCPHSHAQTEDPKLTAKGESAYVVYRYINAEDYLPDRENNQVAHYTRSKVRKALPSKPLMNIPLSFAAVGVFTLLALLIYVIGLMLNDMSREDPVEVEEVAGTLLLLKETSPVSTWQKPPDA